MDCLVLTVDLASSAANRSANRPRPAAAVTRRAPKARIRLSVPLKAFFFMVSAFKSVLTLRVLARARPTVLPTRHTDAAISLARLRKVGQGGSLRLLWRIDSSSSSYENTRHLFRVGVVAPIRPLRVIAVDVGTKRRTPHGFSPSKQ